MTGLKNCFVGIELGFTRIKAVLIDGRGKVLASGGHERLAMMKSTPIGTAPAATTPAALAAALAAAETSCLRSIRTPGTPQKIPSSSKQVRTFC